MKKIASFSFITAVALSANMLPNNVINTSSLAQENGGTKTAIDAYSDGGGAYVISSQGGVKMDNSPMNNLVFKFGDNAKANNVRLDDQVITIDALISTTAQKADAVKLNAVKLALEGTTCNDNDALTMLDHYENGVCVGTVMNCQNGFFGDPYNGSIFCNYENITNITLENYSNLISIIGSVELGAISEITNVYGLRNLKTVTIDLRLNDNPKLQNVNDLLNLTSVGRVFYLYNNQLLTNISGLRNLKTIGTVLYLNGNPLLEDLSPLNNLISVGNSVRLDNKNYTVKMNANSYLCQNYTKIYFYGGAWATATTKLQVCNP